MTTNIGLDLGYSAVKLKTALTEATFSSIVGTPEQAQFKLSGVQSQLMFTYNEKTYNVGDDAITHSAFTSRKENRDWLQSDQYMVLLHAALYSAFRRKTADITLVTGLPVSFYDNDRAEMKEKFQQTHIIQKYGESPFSVIVNNCFVIPQVMGALFNAALNESGNISDVQLATGRVGVIDIGGKTTNMLHAHKLGDISRETVGLDIGGWDVVRALRPKIENVTPDVAWADHEIAEVIIQKSVSYRGNEIDLTDTIDKVLEPMAETIIDKANELWAGGARFNQIILSGGGALLLGDYLVEGLEHKNVQVMEDSVMANAYGYYKAALFYENKGS